jgi:hypothetical protein
LNAHGLNASHGAQRAASTVHHRHPDPGLHGDEDGELGLCFGYLLEAHGLRACHTGTPLVTPELVAAIRCSAITPNASTNGFDYFRPSRGIVGNMNGREAVSWRGR